MEAMKSFSPCSKETVLPVVSVGSVKVKIIGPKPSAHPQTRFGEEGQLFVEKGVRQTLMKAPGSTCDRSPKDPISNSDGKGTPILQICDGAKHSLVSELYHQGNKRKPSTSSPDAENLPVLKVCDDAKLSLELYHQGKKRKTSTSPSPSAEMPKVAKKRRTNYARPGKSWNKTSPKDALENACVPDNAHSASARTARQARRLDKKTPLIHLSSEEIVHDLRLITGQQRLRRQAKRPKKVQEEIKNLFPGMNLPRSIELIRYE